MDIVKRLPDITFLRNAGRLQSKLINRLEEYFLQLHEGLGNDTPLELFDLSDHGFFVILEPGDNPDNLSRVGLPEGLCNSWPEWCDIFWEDDKNQYYRVALMYDNDYIQFFFVPFGVFGDEVDTWLLEQMPDDISSNF